MRKTKIIATIGPVSRDPDTLEQLILAGMDCARLNFSHGTFPEHEEVIRNVRRLAEKHGRHVAILQDLGGVKLRLGHMDEVLNLNHGEEYLVTAAEASGDPAMIPFPRTGSPCRTCRKATWSSSPMASCAWRCWNPTASRSGPGCATAAPYPLSRASTSPALPLTCRC